MSTAEPELITIVEGPPPDFNPTPDLWPLAIYECPQPHFLAMCQMRTFSGPKMVERCRRAWSENRPVMLDYADQAGERKQVSVVATRWSEVPEGHVLHLWVQVPVPTSEE